MISPLRFILPAAALLAAAPAAAEPFPGSAEPVQVVVGHGDLDLTDAADVARLERRIDSSVRRACPALTRNLRETAHAQQCRRTARARATEQKQVAIAAAHANRTRFASNGDDKAVAQQ